MAENNENKNPQEPKNEKMGFKNDNISIEININEKSGPSIGKPSFGTPGASKTADKVKDKAKDVYENIKEKEKEIDLLEVTGNVAKTIGKGTTTIFSALWKAIRVLGIILFRLFMFGVNCWKFILIMGIIGVGCIGYLYMTSKPYYKFDGYGISRITSSQEIIQIINSISIPNDSSDIQLRNDLNLPPEVYNNIMSLKASWLIDKNADGIADLVDYNNDYEINNEKDSISRRMTDRFNVRLQVWDQSITDEVQNALIAYLYNHPYIKNLNSSRLNTIEGMIGVYNQQANILDSLQYYEYFVESQRLEENQEYFGGLKFGDFELKGTLEDRDKRLYHEQIIQLKENAIESSSSLIYNKEPIIFVGNLKNTKNFKNTTERENNFTFYAKKVFIILLPLAFILFIIVKRKEFERIFIIED